MKVLNLIKALLLLALLVCLGAFGVHVLLENDQAVAVHTLLGSFTGVELGSALLICLSAGFIAGLVSALIVCGANLLKVKRLERQIARLESGAQSH